MRDPKRIPLVLDEVRKIWEMAPDLRLAQLIMNVAIYQTEDGQLIELLKEMVSRNYETFKPESDTEATP